ncbi:FAD-binding oxidoreductase [Streptomyces sp. RKND-216]|uniref:FAD-dependent oxidoreductase n=1 Tax=Streptomyces sp. RKND-216 TaxID=2562581 RepID=UPI00109E262C|nr:FAD-dependent oxidoreductase [Streptomyces sp. RKND-216]THA23659.1 FAD-binding oxidoreductase [Streptomyces sp. RKND-216]
MREVLVVGGGVIGLTTAVVLAEEGVRVRVWSREPAERTTSAVAGGLCWPYRIEPAERALEWAVHGFRTLSWLAERPAETGVRLVPGRMVMDDTPERWSALVGERCRTPLVDMTAYLPYLRGRLEAAGGRYAERDVSSLAEAGEEAPVVVHCTGLGARELAGDATMTAVRGQLLVVENPGVRDWHVSSEPGASNSTYLLPQPYGLILGGTAEEGAEGTLPDPATAAAIRERCARVHPAVADAPVLEHRVGLRPCRAAGVRLEREELPGGSVCVQQYGHGGAGVTASWGSAREAADLVRAALGDRPG